MLTFDMFFLFNRNVVKEFLQGKEHFNNIYLAFDNMNIYTTRWIPLKPKVNFIT